MIITILEIVHILNIRLNKSKGFLT